MPYALFTNDEKISRAFPTRSDVWRHAEEAGLVIELPPVDGEPARQELDQDYTIRPCAPDTQQGGEERVSKASGA